MYTCLDESDANYLMGLKIQIQIMESDSPEAMSMQGNTVMAAQKSPVVFDVTAPSSVQSGFMSPAFFHILV